MVNHFQIPDRNAVWKRKKKKNFKKWGGKTNRDLTLELTDRKVKENMVGTTI